jgi:ribonuclease P protein component
MLPKNKRLTASEVREILKVGRTLRTSSLVAKHVPAEKGAFAVAISKKIAKNAIDRNKIRRIIYRELSRSLPRYSRVVFLVQKKSVDFTSDLQTICSKLS